jgi:hypothetical protein
VEKINLRWSTFYSGFPRHSFPQFPDTPAKKMQFYFTSNVVLAAVKELWLHNFPYLHLIRLQIGLIFSRGKAVPQHTYGRGRGKDV